MRAISTGLVVFALLASSAASVRAQPAPPAPPASPAAEKPELQMPRPLGALAAEYPDGASGDARIVVRVTVNADGSVRAASVVEGAEPFAGAALAASSRWRFEPATLSGKPVAATVNAEILFVAPKPPPPEPEAPKIPAPGAMPAAPPPPPPPKPIEVTVYGEQPPPGASTFSRAEVRLLPGAFGDPFRAVEALPGVTPIASGIPFFYVRGAPPGNVGYFLDGIRVPLLYHIGLGPSVVHPGIMERVDLYPGGYPARYGRFAGGIVAGETREPSREWRGEANLRLVDAGALVEAPFDEGRGTALVAGRYSYTAALLSAVQSSVDVRYWDYQGRVSYDLTPRDRVTIFAFGAYDYLGQKTDAGTQILFDTTFHRIDVRYDHRFGPGTTLRQAVTLGYDQTELDRGRYARDKLLMARTELTHRLSEGALLRVGLDASLDDNQVDLDRGDGDVGFVSVFKPHLDLAVGARADVVVQVTRRLEVTPGLRIDLYGSQGKTAVGVDPRLSSRLVVTRSLRLVEAIGIASQPPSFILPGPGFSLGLEGGLQRSFQTSAGVEVDLPEDVSTTATLFRNAFFSMTDSLGSTPSTGTDLDRSFGDRSLGSSIGLEVTARRRLTRRLGAFLSYTLSRSQRVVSIPIIVYSDPPRLGASAAELPSAFDRTHVLSAATSYDFGRGVRAGERVVFYTGTPRTAAVAPGFARTTSERLPPFFRLDLRLEKRWTVGRTSWLSVVLEVQNATLTKETINGQCGSSTCDPQVIGPVTIPSLGLEGGF